jgi:hypothetical protein
MMSRRKIIVLSVHYKYPDLLRDQWRRIRECAGAAHHSLNAELRYRPVVHGGSSPDVIEMAYAVGDQGGASCSCIHLRAKPPTSASAHGDSLTEAVLQLTRAGALHDDDLIAVMDHDAHPVDASLFAVVGEKLLEQKSPAAIGIPQWHRGHCYLHPSFLMAGVDVIRQMGPETAFRARHHPSFWDVCEGFSIWCENNGRAILPLRVNATRYPWSRWDSDMAPDGSAQLVGEHGEPVQVGNLMLYGLDAERSLVSHVWAAPLKRHARLARLKRWLTNSTPGLAADFNERDVLSAYLAEPLR